MNATPTLDELHELVRTTDAALAFLDELTRETLSSDPGRAFTPDAWGLSTYRNRPLEAFTVRVALEARRDLARGAVLAVVGRSAPRARAGASVASWRASVHVLTATGNARPTPYAPAVAVRGLSYVLAESGYWRTHDGLQLVVADGQGAHGVRRTAAHVLGMPVDAIALADLS